MEERVYQSWQGSNKFLFHGRLIFGPDVRSLLVTLFLLIGPAVIFCVFVARDLLDRFSNNGGIAIMVVMVVYTAYILVLLLLTSGRDPGIIPRNAHPPEPEEDAEDWTPRRPARTKDVIVNGVAVKIKYCDTCMLYRPPRCSHCSICNNCVERFDHHCPWVGQCIGQRNYRFFFMFVSSATLMCVYVFAMCALEIKFVMDDHQSSAWKAMRKSPASIALMAYTFVAVWFVGGLTLFHLYLIGTNQTTYENFRYRYDNKVNPYNLGVVDNFREIFFSKIAPSKNHFRGKVTTESSGQGQGARQQMAVTPTATSLKSAGSDLEGGVKPAWPERVALPTSNSGGEVSSDDPGRVSNGGDIGLDIKNGTFSRAPPAPAPAVAGSSALHPRRSSWGRKSGSWEITPDIMALAAGVGGRDEEGRANGAASNPQTTTNR
ncbi:hypothetical protein SELMODRAFT_235280 [Selaginella moellendorffii]|uniref:S-acyltransferase n=1 Tax=Selaginella moellendorffii TaxID=88036 RepID=D8SVS6_SELML|nr:probable protein S-acyltransferase 7 [Selaginella moellendorffii]XP_024517019.1 probable protein S-acyltransferase 7 [Selaginella moellendorffii]EFJ11550.1 hypothetical protein SELMODRAFT_235280 [Selaginella moellendorffii]|eukprot:XP_002987463.1 probable protein S-acyltransferase 7 [Selaginella moellendorffii]